MKTQSELSSFAHLFPFSHCHWSQYSKHGQFSTRASCANHTIFNLSNSPSNCIDTMLSLHTASARCTRAAPLMFLSRVWYGVTARLISVWWLEGPSGGVSWLILLHHHFDACFSLLEQVFQNTITLKWSCRRAIYWYIFLSHLIICSWKPKKDHALIHMNYDIKIHNYDILSHVYEMKTNWEN